MTWGAPSSGPGADKGARSAPGEVVMASFSEKFMAAKRHVSEHAPVFALGLGVGVTIASLFPQNVFITFLGLAIITIFVNKY